MVLATDWAHRMPCPGWQRLSLRSWTPTWPDITAQIQGIHVYLVATWDMDINTDSGCRRQSWVFVGVNEVVWMHVRVSVSMEARGGHHFLCSWTFRCSELPNISTETRTRVPIIKQQALLTMSHLSRPKSFLIKLSQEIELGNAKRAPWSPETRGSRSCPHYLLPSGWHLCIRVFTQPWRIQ